MKDVFSVKEAIHKLEHYCAYQERCHEEVVQKLRSMKMDSDEIDTILVHLISDNFLNEIKTTLVLDHFSQEDAASFIDNDRLFIADERSKSIGGNVYDVSIKKLKPKP